jgi:hypothetical protein
MWNEEDYYIIKEKLIFNKEKIEEDQEEYKEKKEDFIINKSILEVQDEIYCDYLTKLNNKLNVLERSTFGLWFKICLFFKDGNSIKKHNEKRRLKRIQKNVEHPNFKSAFFKKIKVKSALPITAKYFNLLPEESSVYLVKHQSPSASDYLDIEKYDLDSKKLVFNLEKSVHVDFDIQYKAINQENKNIFFIVKSNNIGEDYIHYKSKNHSVFLSLSAAEEFTKEEYKRSIQKKVS